MQTHKKYSGRPVKFVALTAEGADSVSETQKYLDEFGITAPTGYGARQTLSALGVEYYPTLLLLGPDNKVLWTVEQPGDLDSAIERALAAMGK
ncbi:MAG: hypothetical protein WD847_10160 [Pirellulales bacterium]